jgi:hypothetical protein
MRSEEEYFSVAEPFKKVEVMKMLSNLGELTQLFVV